MARSPISTPPAATWQRSGAMWRCPRCNKVYPRAGQGHACRMVSLEEHFRSRPRARELFAAFRATVEDVGGPVRLSVAKTRIGFITHLTFAAVMPRQDYLRGHLVLRRRVASRRFVRVTRAAPYWVHHFEVRSENDLDGQFRSWLAEACALGGGR